MKAKVQYESFLNSAQRAAVYHTGSPLLVLAGAGSGKTRVITCKIVYLIRECGLSPGSILAVTFTNKASNEMKQRVRSLLDEDAELWIRTFHSTAASLLRILGSRVGVNPRFTIIDQQDQFSILRKILREHNLDPEQFKPGTYANLIDRAKDLLLSAEEVLSGKFSSDPVFHDVYRSYEEKLEKENLMDFGDLIYRLVRGLLSNPETLDSLRGRFRYILVDEFQDTNHAQYEFLKLLTLPEGNVCVVGDEDQSIYGFRGAEVENILNFSKEYPGTHIIKLEENYRSVQSILTASSRLISNNRGRIGKNLYTRKGKGGRIMFYRANSDRSEARFIAEEIQKLVYEDGFGYPDIAVFYRMNAQSRVFESVFSRMHIPFTVVGGPRFYEREEVKDILAYVKLAMNPMDEISFARIAAKPPRGIGELTVGAVIDSTVVRGKPVFELGGDSGIPALRLARVRELLDLVAELSGMVEHTPPQRLLKLLFDASGYTEWLQSRGEEERIRNLEELYNAVDEFSREHPGVPISVFVEEVSLNQGGVETGAGHGGVFLITLHNAKGLEFPVVFIAGMEEGIFPHYLSGDSVPDLQEERRLCYVGMTRAMERLYLTAAKVRKLYGRNIERGISKFLMEIPEELVDYREESSLLTAGWPAGRGSSFSGPVASRRKAAGSAPGSAAGPGFKERVVPELKLNDRVRHEQYGSGRVVKIDDGIVSIHFDDGKKMMFLLKYTPLRKEAEASETGHGF